jgi:hypothetical protein
MIISNAIVDLIQVIKIFIAVLNKKNKILKIQYVIVHLIKMTNLVYHNHHLIVRPLNNKELNIVGVN